MIAKAFSYFFYSVVGAGIGFLTILYLTRALSPEEFGYIGLFLSIVYVAFPLLAFRAEGLIGINRVTLSNVDYIHYRNVYVSFVLVFSLFFLILSVLLGYFFLSHNNLFLVVVAVIVGLARVFISISSSEMVQSQKASLYGRLNLVTSISVLVMTIVLTSFLEMSWKGRLLSILLVEVSMAYIRLKCFSDLNDSYYFVIDKKIIGDIVSYGFPLFFALALSWVVFESDKVVVLNLFTLEQLGYYSFAYSIGMFVNTINQSVSNALVPLIYNKLNAGEGRNFVRKYNLLYSLFVILLAVVLIVIFIVFGGFLFGDKYSSADVLVSLIIFSFAFSGIYRTSGVVINFFKLNVVKTKILLVCALVDLFLTFSLIPIFGVNAPAIGTLVGFVLLAVISYWFSSKEIRSRGIEC